MKKITSTVSYIVPNWNFCNIDKFDFDTTVPKETCGFCVKTRGGYRCALHDESLSVNDGLISKTRQCCRATAGFGVTVDAVPQTPTVSPKEIIKQTIELYSSTVNELVKQGYPQSMAESIAKKHLTGGK
jgi:hypothetical protein